MTSSLRYQVRRVSSSFWILRGRLTSRRPHTAMYNDGPARRVSVSVFAKPTSSMKRSASIADSMRRSSSRRHLRSPWSSICSGRGGVVIGLRAAGSAKGNFWLDSALEHRRPDHDSPFGDQPDMKLRLIMKNENLTPARDSKECSKTRVQQTTPPSLRCRIELC